MGEATPVQQHPAAGGFLPMLGGLQGMGSMPGGGGGGGPGGPNGRGGPSAVPQLHSAIVERLRARIELCRRHHSTCENRYQRGQAETSDREHESTLHLLNIVHQGPGNRKAKGGRGAAAASASNQQQPPEYSRGANGEQGLKAQGSSEGEQKINTRIALQGSLRRKLEGSAPGGHLLLNPKQNGLSCGGGLNGSDFKRIRVDPGGLGGGAHHGGGGGGPCGLHGGQNSAQQTSSSSSFLQRSGYMMPHGVVGSDLFHMTLKEMKKEPVEQVLSCGHSSSTTQMIFDFKEEAGGGQIDPELQDLFDELTKSVPSLDDLELEKMLKQDDTFGLDLGGGGGGGGGRPSSAGAAPTGAPTSGGGGGGLCPALDKPIKTEYISPDFGHHHAVHGGCGSPQLRPASAGPSFTLNGGGSGSQKAQNGGQQGGGHPPPPPRGLPCWPEMSHAEQLKQMAANQHHQHHVHQHHHQPTPGGMGGWAPAGMGGGGFPQDKVSGGAAVPPRLASQSKGINNCLFKSNGHSSGGGGPNHLDMKVLGTKPTLHFSPKAPPPHSVSQPLPGMASSLGKASSQQQQQQQQSSAAAQSASHSALHYQNSQQGSLCLQAKPAAQHGAGINFKLAQQRQGIPPGPRLPTNGNIGGLSSQSNQSNQSNQPSLSQQQQQQRPPAAGSQQQKGSLQTKVQPVQRQLNQQHHTINNSEKDNTQEQFNRHLTRPPPDYKQTRGIVGVQQGNAFAGLNASQTLSSGPQNDLQSMSCHLPNGVGPKMTSISTDRRFGMGTDCHPASCIGQFPQQHSNQNRMGQNQNKPRFPGANNIQANSFGMNNNNAAGAAPPPQHPREQQSTGAPTQQQQALGGLMSNANAGWASGNKQGAAGMGIRRLPNPHLSQGAQLDLPNHPYQQQRHMAPPNQVAPGGMGMLPLNPAIRGAVPPRPGQSMMSSVPAVAGSLSQASPEQRVPTAGNFSVAPPGPNLGGGGGGGYQSNRANRLTFDFLPDGDNTVPGINTDSDFIDSLLKSGSGNDDWMKDINLDEILGSHS